MINDDWWPEPLKSIPEENPLSNSHVVVAEISKPWGPQSFYEFNTALVPLDLLFEVVDSLGGVPCKVESSGPHPCSHRGSFNYEPRFKFKAKGHEFEPLVVSWKSGDYQVWLPDQGFLMTYGLVPRISEKDNLIYWDDPQEPKHNIVICKPLSEYFYELQSEARVLIDRQYLQDYATVRNCSLVRMYYAKNGGDLGSEFHEIMGNEHSKDIKLKGRLINLGKTFPTDSDDSKLIAQVWGSRLLIVPKDSPVIEGQWEYGELRWPGIKEPITEERARRAMPSEFIYVRDTVLNKYEAHPDLYEIHPESGSVNYKGQWGVPRCGRVGRDIIEIELKKIYEGVPPDVTRHFHQYAVEPPSKPWHKQTNEPNIGTRSRRIVYNLVEVGEVLADISNNIMKDKRYTSRDFVKLERSELDYSRWWINPDVRPITRCIPLDMGKSDFEDRCIGLNALIVEGLDEKNLRAILLKMDVDNKNIKEFRSLKLLDLFVQYGLIAIDTGLDFFLNLAEIEKRRLERISGLKPDEHPKTPLKILFALKDLRDAAAHRKNNIDTLLEKAGINRASIQAGWGHELDGLYDRLADSLQEVSGILSGIFE